MRCPECGFPIDEANESQPVCPACGADPAASSGEDDPFASEDSDEESDSLIEEGPEPSARCPDPGERACASPQPGGLGILDGIGASRL